MSETEYTEQIDALQKELTRIREANKAFVKKVAKLRDLQKQYFKTRSHDTLRQSKALETEVDNFIKRCYDRMAEQDPDFQEKVQIIKEKFDAQPCQPSQQ